MYCIKCGKPIEEDAIFCRYCGAKIAPETPGTLAASEPTAQATETLAQENDVLLCLYCGAENTPGDRICGNCGRNLPVLEPVHGIEEDSGTSAASTASHSGYSSAHPYHQLGGWLAVITYGLLVAAILMAVSAIFQSFTLLRYMQFLGYKPVLFGLVMVGAYIPILYYCIHMYGAIKARDPGFLRFYEMTMLIFAGLDAATFILCKLLGQYVSTSDIIGEFFGAAIVFIVWLTYFRKSVRVRTYFGTDEYLKRSIFLKNCQSPEPADRT